MIDDFMKNASGLTKNPLGIIALFISLIYGFACIVLGTSLSNMITQDEKLPLIWFIILFPILILFAFIYLVVHHHEKLYSPGDFRNDEAFMLALNKNKIKRKFKKEAEILQSSEPSTIETSVIPEKAINNDNSEKPVTEAKQLNENLNESPTVTTINNEEKLLNKVANAENWASKELALKYNVSTRVNQSFVTKYGKFEVDFIGNSPNIVYLAEIKYWQADKSTKNLKISLQEFLRKYDKLRGAFSQNKEFKLVVAIVLDRIDEILIKDLKSFVENINDQVLTEFFDYNELKSDHEN